jgi:hypothetical protein
MIIKRILAWMRFRQTRSMTPEDLEAQHEAKRIEDQLETIRVLGRSGPRAFTPIESERRLTSEA